MIIPVSLAICMIGLTACKCPRSKAEAQTTSDRMAMSSDVSEPSGTGYSEGTMTTSETMGAGQQEAIIPLHQERLSVSKQNVDSGQVRLRKVVITEKYSQPVDLRRESLEIIREPAGSAPSGTATTNNMKLFENQEIVIQLREEQPILEKQVVQSGSVVARKNTQVEQRTITGDVRREDVQVDRTAGSANVTYKGQISEAAGSMNTNQLQNVEQPQQQQQQQQPQKTQDQMDQQQ